MKKMLKLTGSQIQDQNGGKGEELVSAIVSVVVNKQYTSNKMKNMGCHEEQGDKTGIT